MSNAKCAKSIGTKSTKTQAWSKLLTATFTLEIVMITLTNLQTKSYQCAMLLSILEIILITKAGVGIARLITTLQVISYLVYKFDFAPCSVVDRAKVKSH